MVSSKNLQIYYVHIHLVYVCMYRDKQREREKESIKTSIYYNLFFFTYE